MIRWYIEFYDKSDWVRLDYAHSSTKATELFHKHRRALPPGTAVRIRKEVAA
jgi:hypothetical protein